MAARVTATEVKAIIETSESDSAIAPQIAIATLLVDEIAAADSTVLAARLKEIERWVAAHFIASSLDPRAKSEGVKGITETIEGSFGMGFEMTRYGQQALILDSTGTLRAKQKGQTAAATLRTD